MKSIFFDALDRRHKGYLALALVFSFSFIFYLMTAPLEAVTYFISDDAYYYFLVAKNIAGGLGSTFDGYNLTNGFHPLWMLLVLPIYYLTGPDTELAIRLVLTMQTLISMASTGLLWLTIKSYCGARAALFALLIFFTLASPVILLFNGLESALLIFLTLLFIRADQQLRLFDDQNSKGKKIALGALFGALALTRLDGVFFMLAAVILKLIFSFKDEPIFKRIGLLAISYLPTYLTFFIIVTPYFIWNYSTFEHFSPISGKLKSTFPNPITDLHLSAHTYPYLISVALAVTLVLFDLIRSNSLIRSQLIPGWLENGKDLILGIFFIGSLAHLAWTQFFMAWGVYQWHFSGYLGIIIVIYCHAYHQLFNASAKIKKLGILPIVLAGCILLGYSAILIFEKGEHHKGRIEGAEWASENIPEGKGVLISDAGAFAYFSDTPTVNLDGLINGYSFQESIANDTMFQFLEQYNIEYIADAFTLCHKEESTELVEAYRGKNRDNPVGYQFSRKLSQAAFVGEKVSHRPLSRNENICFAIWKIDQTKHIRLDGKKY